MPAPGPEEEHPHGEHGRELAGLAEIAVEFRDVDFEGDVRAELAVGLHHVLERAGVAEAAAQSNGQRVTWGNEEGCVGVHLVEVGSGPIHEVVALKERRDLYHADGEHRVAPGRGVVGRWLGLQGEGPLDQRRA